MKKFLFCTVLSALLWSGTAAAGLINTSVGTLDITTTETSYTDGITQLQSQVWFGNETLAREIAALMANSLGTQIGFPNLSPYIAYGSTGDSVLAALYGFPEATDVFSGAPGNSLSDVRLYVVATVPEPGTLGLLALGLLGLGIARRNRTA